jgi:hypothetical protein
MEEVSPLKALVLCSNAASTTEGKLGVEKETNEIAGSLNRTVSNDE